MTSVIGTDDISLDFVVIQMPPFFDLLYLLLKGVAISCDVKEGDKGEKGKRDGT